MRKHIHVAVGVIHDAEGRILVARRAANQHQGGLLEFPGGKVEAGETVNEALTRELYEELGIRVLSQTPLCCIHHDYVDKSVVLDVWNVNDFAGEAHGREGQPLHWLMPQELKHEDFPQANRAIIRAIQLPDFIALISSGYEPSVIHRTLSQLPSNTLVRLRQWQQSAIPEALEACRKTGAGVIIDLTDGGDQHWLQSALDHTIVRGVHCNRHVLRQLSQRPVPEHMLFGVSCHDAAELQLAAALGADYVLLSPVLETASHAGQPAMGWQHFETLARSVDIAVYAMGGLQTGDLARAQACGARGIAGIRLFESI